MASVWKYGHTSTTVGLYPHLGTHASRLIHDVQVEYYLLNQYEAKEYILLEKLTYISVNAIHPICPYAKNNLGRACQIFSVVAVTCDTRLTQQQ